MAGCGGALDTDLLGGPGGSDGGQDASTSADTGTGSDGGVSTTDASVNDGGTTSVDAEPILDAKPIFDAGPSDPGILCFTQYNPPIATYCKNGTDMCCIHQSASACILQSQASSCQTGTRLSCDDSSSCDNGKVCCGSLNTFNGNAYYSEVTCATTCAVSTQTPGLRRFCNPKALVDECTAIGLTCKASNVLNGYYVCGN